ncbi:MAG: hypothetical protein ACMXYF_03725 [Candidatus Woesearchaeota archaeon]
MSRSMQKKGVELSWNVLAVIILCIIALIIMAFLIFSATGQGLSIIDTIAGVRP